MAKLITNSQIKKSIKNCERDECVELILEIAQACPQAREYMTIRFTENQSDILEKYKKKVEYEFYPPRGFGRLNLREAKKAISDFKKIYTDKAMLIDIMLFYVENCVKFTDDYGDINETFYCSAEGMFDKVKDEINSADIKVYEKFADRLRAVTRNACAGWGFQDCMFEIYYEIEWVGDDE
jgi:hypothetical protein